MTIAEAVTVVGAARPAVPVLSLRGLTKTFGGGDRRFTLTVDRLDLLPGEVAALTGPSGSGKSTLLEIIGLATTPDAVERFTLAGEAGPVDVASLLRAGDRTALAALRAGRIGFVVQTGGLLPFLTVAANVALAQQLAGRRDEATAALLLEALGLARLAQAWPAELSVGQRQRAAVARALAHRPSLLLADEPTAALDPTNKMQAIDLILELADRFGAAVLVATHERGVFRDRPVRRLSIDTVATAEGVAARLELAA